MEGQNKPTWMEGIDQAKTAAENLYGEYQELSIRSPDPDKDESLRHFVLSRLKGTFRNAENILADITAGKLSDVMTQRTREIRSYTPEKVSGIDEMVTDKILRDIERREEESPQMERNASYLKTAINYFYTLAQCNISDDTKKKLHEKIVEYAQLLAQTLQEETHSAQQQEAVVSKLIATRLVGQDPVPEAHRDFSTIRIQFPDMEGIFHVTRKGLNDYVIEEINERVIPHMSEAMMMHHSRSHLPYDRYMLEDLIDALNVLQKIIQQNEQFLKLFKPFSGAGAEFLAMLVAEDMSKEVSAQFTQDVDAILYGRTMKDRTEDQVQERRESAASLMIQVPGLADNRFFLRKMVSLMVNFAKTPGLSSEEKIKICATGLAIANRYDQLERQPEIQTNPDGQEDDAMLLHLNGILFEEMGNAWNSEERDTRIQLYNRALEFYRVALCGAGGEDLRRQIHMKIVRITSSLKKFPECLLNLRAALTLARDEAERAQIQGYIREVENLLAANQNPQE